VKFQMFYMKKFLFLIVISLAFIACNTKHDYKEIFSNPDVYCKTVYELNDVVMGNNFSPVVASRNYLYANVAAYEIIAGGYPDKYTSLGNQLNGLGNVPQPDKSKQIDYQFASLIAFWKLGKMVTFSDDRTNNYVDSLEKLAKAHGMPEEIYNNSIEYADTVAATIMAWSKKDNYLQTRGMPDYTVMPDSPARWIPTPPAYSGATEPHWNMIRTVAMDSVNEILPPPPFCL